MTRQRANKAILKHLEVLVDMYPDFRFQQLLVNADVLKTEIDPHLGGVKYSHEYHLESEELLDRVRSSKIWEVT